MKLSDFRDLLLTIGVPVFHFEAHKSPDKYIIWAEEGQGRADTADDHMIFQSLRGIVEYYTKMEFDPVFNIIQAKLNSADIVWKLALVQRDNDKGYIRYVWEWEMGNSLE